MEEVTVEGLLNKSHEYSRGRAEWECERQHKKKRRTYREKQGRESGKADSVGSIIT